MTNKSDSLLVQQYRALTPDDQAKRLEQFLGSRDVPRGPELTQILLDDLSENWAANRFQYLIHIIPELRESVGSWGLDAFLAILLRDLHERQERGLDASQDLYFEMCPDRREHIERQFQVNQFMLQAEIEASINDSIDLEMPNSPVAKQTAQNETRSEQCGSKENNDLSECSAVNRADNSSQNLIDQKQLPVNEDENNYDTQETIDECSVEQGRGTSADGPGKLTADILSQYTVFEQPSPIRYVSGSENDSELALAQARQSQFPTVPNHAILKELGRGAFGRVYLAIQLHPDTQVRLRKVAVKVLTNQQGQRNFQDEIKIVAGLQHSNIVPLWSMGSCQMPSRGHAQPQEFPFFSMELVEGGTLAEKIQSESLSPEQIAELSLLISRGLAAAHEKGVTHCDLKPQNILLSSEDVPKLSDFGLAVEFEKGELPSGGTYLYMAPEVASKEDSQFGPTADIYALGVILYEMMTGHKPLTGKDVRALVLENKRIAILPPSEHVKSSGQRFDKNFRRLEAICMKCLSTSPDDRYETGKELVEEFKRFLAIQPLIAKPVGRLSRLMLWAKREPIVSALSAIIVVVSVLGFVVSYAYSEIATAEKNKAIDAHRESLQRNVRMQIANGWLQSEQFGLAAALPANAEAIRLLDENPYGFKNKRESFLQRVRFAAISNQVSEVKAIWRHDRSVTSLVVSKDARFLASSSLDKCVVIWDRRKNEQLHKLIHTGRVNHAAFSQDGKWLATACQNQQVHIWDVKTGKQTVTPLLFKEPVIKVAFSPDGTKLAACGGQKYRPYGPMVMKKILLPGPGGKKIERFMPDTVLPPYPGQMVVWRTKNWKPVGKPIKLDGCMIDVKFSSTGTHLLASTFTVMGKPKVVAGIWDSNSLTSVGPVLKAAGNTMHAQFTPDGHRVVAIASSNDSGKSILQVLDLRTNALIKSDLPHQEISSFDISPDGNKLITGSLNNTAWIWNLHETSAGESTTSANVLQLERSDIRHLDSVLDVRFSADGNSVTTVCRDNVVRIWNLLSPTRKPIQLNCINRVRALAFVNETHLACGSDSGQITLWKLRDGSLLTMRPTIPARDRSKVHGVGIKYADDATLVGFLGYERSLLTINSDAHTRKDRWRQASRVFRANITEKSVGQLQEPGGVIRQIGANGRFIVSIAQQLNANKVNDADTETDEDDSNVGIVNPNLKTRSKHPWNVYTWDSLTAKVVGKPLNFKRRIHDAFIFDNNKRIAVASSDNKLLICNVSSGKTAVSIALNAPVHRVRVSPDSKTAIIVRKTPESDSYDLVVIDLESQNPRPKIIEVPKIPTELQIADNSKFAMAVVGMSAAKWQVVVVRLKDGELLHQSIQHSDRINSATFDRRSRRILTASNDRTVRMWDLKTGESVGYVAYHEAAVNHATLSPDERFLATSARDGSARVWEVATGEPVTPNLWHLGEVWQSTFSPNSLQLATASDDGSVRLWNLQPDQRKPSELMRDAVLFSRFRIDGRGRSVPIESKNLLSY